MSAEKNFHKYNGFTVYIDGGNSTNTLISTPNFLSYFSI